MTNPLIFLDCEFTSLAAPALLALGLSDGVGREFYGELDQEQRQFQLLRPKVSAFTSKTVLPQLGLLPHSYATSELLGTTLAAWLKAFAGAGTGCLDVAYDYHTDFDLLEHVLEESGHWEALKARLNPVHVAYLWGTDDADQAAAASWSDSQKTQGFGRHHALADARALASAFEAVHGVDKALEFS